MVRRKTIVGDALRYVNMLRSHMQWEELDLFHRIEEMITEGHTIFDEANSAQIADPVFGAEGQFLSRDFGIFAQFAWYF